MYLVRELNKRKLFQRTSNFILNDNCRDLLPQVFYRASACILSFERIVQYQYKCADEFALFDDKVNIQDNRILFVSAISISILNEITPLLSSLRIMQNQFIGLVSKYYQKSLPSSIKDFIKKSSKYDLPEEIKRIISEYWDQSGEFLKNLRDIDQHFYHLIENSFMTINPKKKVNILFPDNPDCKSPASFKFEKNIDGLEFLFRTFQEINKLYESFSEFVGFDEKDIIFSVGFKHLMKEDVNDKRTLFMFYEEFLQNAGNNRANLIIKALLFNQLPGGKVEMYETGLSEAKNKKLNEFLAKK